MANKTKKPVKKDTEQLKDDYFLLGYYGDNNIPLYGSGGWFKENFGNVLKTGLGIGAMFIPGLHGVGAGMIGSGVGGMIGGIGQDEEDDVNYINEAEAPRVVGLKNLTPNVMSFAEGGPYDLGKYISNLGDYPYEVNPLFLAKQLHSYFSKNPERFEMSGKSYKMDDKVFEKYPDFKYINEFPEKPSHYTVIKDLEQDREFAYPAYNYDQVVESMDQYKKGGIYIKPSKRGSFTAWCKKQGYSGATAECDAAGKRSKSKAIRAKANFSHNSKGWKKADGGILKTPLIEFEGPRHENGGIQLGGAEVEGGETMYNGVINSDREYMIITDEIAADYGLPKKAVGKTPAEYSQMIEKEYEGQDNDPFAMKSRDRKLEQMSSLSIDLSNMAEEKRDKKFVWSEERPKLFNALDLPAVVKTDSTGNETYLRRSKVLERQQARRDNKYQDGGEPEEIPPFYDHYFNLIFNPRFDMAEVPRFTKPELKPVTTNKNIPTTVPEVTRQEAPELLAAPSLKTTTEVTLDPYKRNLITNKVNPLGVNAINPDLMLPKDEQGNVTSRYTKEDFALPENNDLSGSEGLTDFLGLAPIAISAFQAARAGKRKPAEVRAEKIRPQEITPELVDPTFTLQNISDTYAGGLEGLKNVSKRDYMRRATQYKTEEAKAKGQALGQIINHNTQLKNQAKAQNAAQQLRADSLNAELGLRVEDINAANEAAVESTRDMYLNNLATMLGQYGRDVKLDAANERYNNRVLDIMENMFPGLVFDPETGTYSAGPLQLPADPTSVYGKSGAKYQTTTYPDNTSIYPQSGGLDKSFAIPSSGYNLFYGRAPYLYDRNISNRMSLNPYNV